MAHLLLVCSTSTSTFERIPISLFEVTTNFFHINLLVCSHCCSLAQLLGLVLARPSPSDWHMPSLPTHTASPLPIKTTLLVAPASLLPQWEAEIVKHVQPGALKCCTYLGVSHKERAQSDGNRADGSDGGAHRTTRSRAGVGGFGGGGEGAGGEAREQDAAESHRFEVLAATHRKLFVAAGHPEAHTERVEVEKCDLCLVSFETLRDELRKTNNTQALLE